MTVFGSHYPPALQRAVNHAERLAELLATPELASPDVPWVLGRAEEIAGLVEAVVADWRTGVDDEAEAAAAIDTYVAELHVGLRTHFGIVQPRCCNTTDSVDGEPFPR